MTDTATPAATTPAVTETPANASPEAKSTAPVETQAPRAPEPKADAPKPGINPRTREFAALTRKEREVRQREATLKDQLAKVDAWEKTRSSARENPLAVLESLGLTYDDVANYQINGKPAPADPRHRATEDRIAQLEQRLQEREQQIQVEKTQRAIDEYIAKIQKHVQDNPSYELIRAENAAGEVFKLIDLHYQKYGEILDTDTAAQHVEATLEEEKEAEAKKLLGIAKLKRKLGLDGPATDSNESTERPTSPPATGTKDNASDTPTPSKAPSTPKVRPGQNPDDVRWREIVARLARA